MRSVCILVALQSCLVLGATDWAEAGRREFLKGNYLRAQTYIERAVSERPDDAALLSDLAQVLLQMGHRDRAEALLRRALAREPGRIRSLQLLGHALWAQERFPEAEEVLRRVVAHQATPSTLNDLAVVLMNQGKAEPVTALLEQAASTQEPSLSRARIRMNLAIHLHKLGNGKVAEQHMQAAVREVEDIAGTEHPEYGLVLEEYGELLRRQGRKKEAKEARERALRIRSASAPQTNSGNWKVDWRDWKRPK